MTRLSVTSLVLILGTGCATAKLEKKSEEMEQTISSMQRTQVLAAERLNEVNRLSHTVFVLQDRVEQMSLEMSEMRGEIASLQEQPAQVAMAETPRRAVSQPAPAAKPSQASAAAGDAPTVYRKAYEFLMKGDYGQSAPLFLSIIARFPEHELADNAQYWLGEIDYVQQKYRQALEGFRTVLERWPRGNKVPDAMLKMAYCHAELGEQAKARETLERVMKDYPWSDPAKKAKERLQTMGHPGRGGPSAPVKEES
jgi:tol-pal system protein YbgF